ncbi:hypothetical protein TNCV_1206641 [Trichonephila clavipes]|nr:hypothetical protein TNCV_1206641 [Trichonephila clavipes]
MRRIITGGITPSANIREPLPSLVQIDNRAAILNGLLHSNNYEGRRVTRCIEDLPTTPHSALGTSTVA